MTDDAERAIRRLVDAETAAWDDRDVETLLDLFHSDMVWAWPPTPYDHDPADWDLEFGRFDRERWRAAWRDLFDTHDLVRNERETVRVAVGDAGDGGMAVVDIDTLWRHRETGEEFHWFGRTSKIYALCDGEWLLTAHWGALRFDEAGDPITGPAADPATE